MSDRLSARLGDRLRTLATELDLEKHGDPHVGFAVFVYPDRGPEIWVVADKTVQPLKKLIKTRDDDADEDKDGKGRWFTMEDLKVAIYAFHDVEMGMMLRSRSDAYDRWGALIQEYVDEQWEARIVRRFQDQLRTADAEAARPVLCTCGQRFTERGFPQHVRAQALRGRHHTRREIPQPQS